MEIYSFNDYKSLVRAWIREQPKQGYGQFRKIAQHLEVGSVFVSQVFKADRDVSVDQGYKLSEYMGLTHFEKDYFVLLVQKARAETHELREFLQEKIEAIKLSSKTLKNRVDADRELSEIEKAKFYSDWHYSAIRNLSAVPGFNNVKKIAERLDIPSAVAQEAVDFLIQSGLCRLNAGKLEVGTRTTHLEAGSPFIKTRQIHWRMKAVETMNRANTNNLFYTCPMSLSKKSKQEIRAKILQAIQEIIQEVKESPSEEVACLNIDWFEF